MDKQQAISPVTVFYSYAHEDESLRNELNKHLGNLRQQGIITEWYDRLIVAGTDWMDAIDTHLNTAAVILLLISPDFLASDYCSGIEMERALQLHQAKEARVIPVLLRPVDWKGAPFARLQMLPTDARPITTWSDRDKAFVDVATGIRRAIEDLALPSILLHTTSPSVWNIPYRRNPFFTGREDVLRLLHNKLTTLKAATLTQPQAISGLGGIGKTQIALEYAYQYREAYHFVFWIRAATRETLTSDFVSIANLLHLPEKDEQDQNQVIMAVKMWLATHYAWLLILDNADDVAMVSDFMPTGSNGHIMLTSRAQAMGSLAQRINVENMGMVEGTLFLLHRAKMLAEDAFLDQASEEQLARAEAIVIEMDFFPLALDQAGAYIEEIGCSLSAYLDLYRMHRKEILQRRSRLPTDYPETVATTWSLSFQKVEQANLAAADLLRLCAFLEPDVIPEDLISEGSSHLGPVLKRVAVDVLKLNDAIEELRKFSLLQRNPDTRTLSVHRLVQAVLKDMMKRGTQRRWAERVVRATNAVFPEEMETEAWSRCRRYLPQAQSCAMLIQDYAFAFEEAAHLLHRTADYLQTHALYEQAEPLYQRVLYIWERIGGPEYLKMASPLTEMANLYREQGKYVEAEPLYQRALRIQEAAHPEMASSFHEMAVLYQQQGKYAEAEPLYERALRVREAALGPEHPDVASSLHGLAILYYEQGKYAKAEPLYERALRIQEVALGPEHLKVAHSLNNLALFYRNQGRYAEAEPLYERALCTWEAALGPEHPDVAYPLTGLAILYYEQGKYTKAEPLYERALYIREAALGPEHPEMASSLHGLALLYRHQGRYAEAEPLYERALRIWEAALGPEHPEVASVLTGLADLYQYQGKYAKAEPLYEQAQMIMEAALGSEHPEMTYSLTGLADLYQYQGKYAKAEPLYQRALRIREVTVGPEHPDTAYPLTGLADLYQRQGKYTEAKPLYQQALRIREQRLGLEHPDTQSVQEKYVALLCTMGCDEEVTTFETNREPLA